MILAHNILVVSLKIGLSRKVSAKGDQHDACRFRLTIKNGGGCDCSFVDVQRRFSRDRGKRKAQRGANEMLASTLPCTSKTTSSVHPIYQRASMQ